VRIFSGALRGRLASFEQVEIKSPDEKKPGATEGRPYSYRKWDRVVSIARKQPGVLICTAILEFHIFPQNSHLF